MSAVRRIKKWWRRRAERPEPTPHVCQFCGTPLRDHWWDPCTYTPPRHA